MAPELEMSAPALEAKKDPALSKLEFTWTLKRPLQDTIRLIWESDMSVDKKLDALDISAKLFPAANRKKYREFRYKHKIDTVMDLIKGESVGVREAIKHFESTNSKNLDAFARRVWDLKDSFRNKVKIYEWFEKESIDYSQFSEPREFVTPKSAFITCVQFEPDEEYGGEKFDFFVNMQDSQLRTVFGRILKSDNRFGLDGNTIGLLNILFRTNDKYAEAELRICLCIHMLESVGYMNNKKTQAIDQIGGIYVGFRASEVNGREDDSESSDAESESDCSSEYADEEEHGKREGTLYILINLTGRIMVDANLRKVGQIRKVPKIMLNRDDSGDFLEFEISKIEV